MLFIIYIIQNNIHYYHIRTNVPQTNANYVQRAQARFKRKHDGPRRPDDGGGCDVREGAKVEEFEH